MAKNQVKIHSSVSVFPKKTYTGSKTEQYEIASGSRIVMSLVVTQIDPGATVLVTAKDKFSLDMNAETKEIFSLNKIGSVKKIVTDFHTLLDFDLLVSNGNAELIFGITVHDNDGLRHESKISTFNSTNVLLNAGETFTGEWEECLGYTNIAVTAKPSHDSAVDGLIIEQSTDGINVSTDDVYTILANVGSPYSFGVSHKYFRIRFINGASNQTSFDLQTILHVGAPKPSSHRIGDVITSENDAELVKSVLTGQTPNGDFKNNQSDENGNLIVTPVYTHNSSIIAGEVITGATTRVAVRKTAYNEQTTNAQRSIASSSASDSAAGIGARIITIKYFDQNMNGPFTETLNLNGVTPVNTVNTNICYIQKIEIERGVDNAVGSNGMSVGSITLFAAVAGGGGTIGSIAAGDSQTFWTHLYCPVNKICKITSVAFSSTADASAEAATFTLRSRKLGTNRVESRIGDNYRIHGTEASIKQRLHQSPIVIEGPARIVGYVQPDNRNTNTQYMSFDYYEVL